MWLGGNVVDRGREIEAAHDRSLQRWSKTKPSDEGRIRRSATNLTASGYVNGSPPVSGAIRAAPRAPAREPNEPYFTIDRSSARLALTMSRSFPMLSR